MNNDTHKTQLDFVLAALGLTLDEIHRYRGWGITAENKAVYIEDPVDDQRHIWIVTRTGGGNREHIDLFGAEGNDCDCYSCWITYKVPKLAWYITDEDDDCDSTYALIYFSWPPEFEQLLTEIAAFKGDEQETQAFERELERKYGYGATLAKGRKLAAEYQQQHGK